MMLTLPRPLSRCFFRASAHTRRTLAGCNSGHFADTNARLPVLLTGRQAERDALDAGFSLIEVLISLVIIAVGMLGVAGIMALSMNNDTSSRLQSLAALEATSMATAIQTNQAYWVNGTGANYSKTAPTTSSQACNGTICTASDMASEDLSNWGYTIAQSLPNGTGTVDCSTQPQTGTSPAATTCSIGIQWQANQMANDHQSTTATSATQSYVLVVQP